MTDPELVHRAEQAYLGAILARHGQTGTGAVVAGDADPSAVMHTGDFTNPVHQAIFTAISGQPGSIRPDGPSGWLGRLRDLLERLFSSRARQAAAYVAELPTLCPDPANLPAYAAMVAEASQDRADQARARQAEHAASEDSTLASAGAWLDNTGTAIRRQAHPGPAPVTGSAQATHSSEAWRDQAAASLAPNAARLARALRADTRKATRPDPAQEHRPKRSAGRATSPDLAMRVGDSDRSAHLKPEDLEDRILASLMKHPAEGRAVIEWLPAEAFSTAPLRDLYDLIRHRLANGRPIDPLIIAWDASRLPDLSFSEEYGGSAFLTQVALQAGALDPAPGTAEVLGRTLWAERILTNTLGEDWVREPERIRMLIVIEPDDPGQGPDPASATTAQAPPVGPAPDDPSTQPGTKSAVTAAAGQHLVAAVPGPAQPVPLRQPPSPVPSGPALRM